MVKDAEAHAEEDKKRRELVEAKNQADGLIHTTEQTLAEAGDKVPEAEKTPVQAAIQALKDVVGGDNVEEIKSKTEALAQVAMKLWRIDVQDAAGCRRRTAGRAAGPRRRTAWRPAPGRPGGRPRRQGR